MGYSRTVALPGVELSVEVWSGDPTTVFVHGFGGDMHSWDALWSLLPRGRGHLRYDLRGFGGSSATNNDPFHHPDDLGHLLDALEIGECHLVGVSMGGSIAINFSLSWPDRVRSVALLSPGLTAWEWSEEWLALWKPITEAARSGDMRRARAIWLAHPLFGSTRESNAARMLADEVSRFSGEQWIRDRPAPALPDLERLHELEQPVLLLTGARDFPDFRLIASLIEATVPHLIRHDAADLGHLVHLEAPEWCRDKLTAFWADQN